MKKPPVKQYALPIFEKFLKENPGGLRAKELTKRLHKETQAAGYKSPLHGIGALLSILADENSTKFGKTKEKGIGTIYYYKDPEQTDTKQASEPNVAATSPTKRKEKDFYKSFATYLEYAEDTEYLDECTKAVAWGGNKSGGTWATPDVVGVLFPEQGALIHFSHEIVSAEIKIDRSSANLFIAFGQACAYCLFSHKVYLVVPKPRDVVVHSRIKASCLLFGLGLVYFNPDTKVINPSIYKLELPARRRSPDMSYASNFVSGDLEHELYGKTPRRKKL